MRRSTQNRVFALTEKLKDRLLVAPAMSAMTSLFGGMGLAFAVLFIQAAADVGVSYIPIKGEHRTLRGWISDTTGV